MAGHVCSLSASRFAVSPSESFCLAVGSDQIARAFSLSTGGAPLRTWSVVPFDVLPGDQSLFVNPSWLGERGGLEGKVWVGSRHRGDVYILDLEVQREE